MSKSDIPITNELDRLVKALHKKGRPRVWSLIITLFGDAIVPRKGVVSLISIQEIFAELQIEENAVRTAMSRLTKEGWLERIKHGRQSFYRLAPEGMEQFETATQRIYSTTKDVWSGTFDLVIKTSDDAKTRDKQTKEMADHGFGSPTVNVFVRPSSDIPIPAQNAIAILKSQSQSDQMLRQLVDASWPIDALQKGYETLLTKYASTLRSVSAASQITPMDALVLRILLIHDWRRVVLKDVDLPQALKPENWAGERARQSVGELYHLLLLQSEKQLDRGFASPNVKLPAPEKDIHNRFTNS